MKENDKCEQYLHIFLKLQQARFKLDYWKKKSLRCLGLFRGASAKREIRSRTQLRHVCRLQLDF